MKLSTILSFVFIFGLFAVMGTTLFNSLGSTYGVTYDENISESYDNLQAYYDEIESVQGQVEGTDSATETNTDINFIANPKALWSSIQLFFNNFKFVGEITNNVANDLGIPSVVVIVITGLILLSLIAVIVGIAVRSNRI
jgi:hypothetical protein